MSFCPLFHLTELVHFVFFWVLRWPPFPYWSPLGFCYPSGVIFLRRSQHRYSVSEKREWIYYLRFDYMKHFLCPIRSRHPLGFLGIVRWESVPRGSFVRTWKLSFPFLLTRLTTPVSPRMGVLDQQILIHRCLLYEESMECGPPCHISGCKKVQFHYLSLVYLCRLKVNLIDIDVSHQLSSRHF